MFNLIKLSIKTLLVLWLANICYGHMNEQQTYLLISTSSKLYCMKMPELIATNRHNYYRFNHGYYDDLKNYEIIYEEKTQNNWITDAFYVKSESLIYVNVYNSTSATSDIFTLKFDKSTNTWVKKVLYRDQSYCLGIAYNEDRKELYWTAGKWIVSGSSLVTNSKQFKTLYNLDLAKKLLYLKYDALVDTIYVSTLNYVYACPLKHTDCKIIARDLVSARGLYLDSVNRNLYVVDHKKKLIKRIKLNNHDNQYFNDMNSIYDPTIDTASNINTILSPETIPDIGDVFYMSIHNKVNTNMLIWSEFSGKIKMANLNDTSNYRVIFSTNEYTYSVNIMDNSTYSPTRISTTNIPLPSSSMIITKGLTSTTVVSTTVVIPTTSTESTHSVESESDASSSSSLSSSLSSLSSSSTLTESISTSPIKSSSSIELETDDSIETETTQPLLSWTRNRNLNSKLNEESLVKTTTSTIYLESKTESSTNHVAETDTISTTDSSKLTTKTSISNEESNVSYENDYQITSSENNSNEQIQTETAESNDENEESSSEILPSKTSGLASTTILIPTTLSTEKISEQILKKQNLQFVQKINSDSSNTSLFSTSSTDESEDGANNLSKSPTYQVQNLRGLNLAKNLSSVNTSTSLIRSSPQLNVALYIVICLLCFSLIINIILLYISKMKQNRDKLIITHEIREKSESMPSQRSGLTSKTSNCGELAECNMNLINSNGNASIGIDLEQ